MTTNHDLSMVVYVEMVDTNRWSGLGRISIKSSLEDKIQYDHDPYHQGLTWMAIGPYLVMQVKELHTIQLKNLSGSRTCRSAEG